MARVIGDCWCIVALCNHENNNLCWNQTPTPLHSVAIILARSAVAHRLLASIQLKLQLLRKVLLWMFTGHPRMESPTDAYGWKTRAWSVACNHLYASAVLS